MRFIEVDSEEYTSPYGIKHCVVEIKPNDNGLNRVNMTLGEDLYDDCGLTEQGIELLQLLIDLTKDGFYKERFFKAGISTIGRDE